MTRQEARRLRNRTITPILRKLHEVSDSTLKSRFANTIGWQKLLWCIANHESGRLGLSNSRTSGRGGARSIYQIQENAHDTSWRFLARHDTAAEYIHWLSTNPSNNRSWRTFRRTQRDYVWYGPVTAENGETSNRTLGDDPDIPNNNPELSYNTVRTDNSRPLRRQLLNALQFDKYATAITLIGVIRSNNAPTVNNRITPQDIAEVWRDFHKRRSSNQISTFLGHWLISVEEREYPFSTSTREKNAVKNYLRTHMVPRRSGIYTEVNNILNPSTD